MDYEKLLTGVDEVRQAARAAASVYLAPFAAGSESTDASVSALSNGSGTLLDDPKVRALLDAALRNPALFARPPAEIFDLAGNVVFRDFVFALSGDAEARVRTGANKALGAAIVSLSIAKPWDRDAAIRAARARAVELNLGQPKDPVRVVCYAYPRLGIVFESRGEGLVVMDLMDGDVHQVPPGGKPGFWMPYDTLSAYAADERARRFSKETAALADATPATLASAEPLGLEASTGKLEHKIALQLTVQQRRHFCAPAASAMILHHFGIADIDQFGVARAFAEAAEGDADTNLEIIRRSGTPPLDQQKGLARLCQSKGLMADLVFSNEVQENWNLALPRILNELANDRPVQRQLKVPAHVDVLAGWQGMAGTDDLMLWVYDPMQPNGDVRLDRWDTVSTNINDLIFVHPPGV